MTKEDVKELYGIDVVFQQDGTPCYEARSTICHFETCSVCTADYITGVLCRLGYD